MSSGASRSSSDSDALFEMAASGGWGAGWPGHPSHVTYVDGLTVTFRRLCCPRRRRRFASHGRDRGRNGPDRSGQRRFACHGDGRRIGQPVDRLFRQRAVDPGLQIKGQQLPNGGGAVRRHGGISGALRYSRADRTAAKRPTGHFHGCSRAKNRKQTACRARSAEMGTGFAPEIISRAHDRHRQTLTVWRVTHWKLSRPG